MLSVWTVFWSVPTDHSEGHTTQTLVLRKAGLSLPQCDLEQFASLCLDVLNQETILTQGTVWLSDQDGQKTKFSVDTLMPLECGFTNKCHSLNN